MNEIILGDCLDVLREMPSGAVDCVVTDPPYGLELGVKNNQQRDGGHLHKQAYASYDDTYENFVSLIVPRLQVSISIAKRAAVFTGPHIQEQPKAVAMGGIYLLAATGRTPWGTKNFLPILFYGSPTHPGRHRPTVLRSFAIAEKTGHPVTKPLSWMKWLIELVSKPGDTILDPFMGSGTTGVAAVQTGRNFIGIEIDEGYFNIAKRRIAQAQAQPPLIPHETQAQPVQNGLYETVTA